MDYCRRRGEKLKVQLKKCVLKAVSKVSELAKSRKAGDAIPDSWSRDYEVMSMNVRR